MFAEFGKRASSLWDLGASSFIDGLEILYALPRVTRGSGMPLVAVALIQFLPPCFDTIGGSMERLI